MKKVALFVKVNGEWRFEGYSPLWIWKQAEAGVRKHVEEENGPGCLTILYMEDDK